MISYLFDQILILLMLLYIFNLSLVLFLVCKSLVLFTVVLPSCLALTKVTCQWAPLRPWSQRGSLQQRLGKVCFGWEPNQPSCVINGKSSATLHLLQKSLKIFQFLKSARKNTTDRAREDHSPGTMYLRKIMVLLSRYITFNSLMQSTRCILFV